jgi:hypothetical protein
MGEDPFETAVIFEAAEALIFVTSAVSWIAGVIFVPLPVVL